VVTSSPFKFLPYPFHHCAPFHRLPRVSPSGRPLTFNPDPFHFQLAFFWYRRLMFLFLLRVTRDPCFPSPQTPLRKNRSKRAKIFTYPVLPTFFHNFFLFQTTVVIRYPLQLRQLSFPFFVFFQISLVCFFPVLFSPTQL